MNYLRDIWGDLISQYSNNYFLIEELWAEIENNYTTNKRHYHNLKHVEYLVELAFKHKDNLEDFEILLFSIYYHDVVYDTTSKDNEQKSAEFARKRLLKIDISPDRINKCYNQIIATKTHAGNTDNDTKYLLDFDLAILGDPEEKYHEYTKNIRGEYSNYTDNEYKKGRTQIIEHFLEMDRIYKTDVIHKSHEQQARSNLKSELLRLAPEIS